MDDIERFWGLDLLDYQKKYLNEMLKITKDEPLIFIPRRKIGSFIMVVPQIMKLMKGDKDD